MKAEDIKKLSEPFPRSAISWRAQTLNQDGTKALALAYIDARDVMDRLDEVCGPENWQDRYEFHGPRTVCYLSIRVDGEWITKGDGAGDSDVEAEKGAISDALKRSAVKWGIARYLYNMPNVWAPCESADKNGKKYWRKWTGDPWDAVRNAPDLPAKAPEPKQQAKPQAKTPTHPASYDDHSLMVELRAISSMHGLKSFWMDNIGTFKAMGQEALDAFTAAKNERKAAIEAAPKPKQPDTVDDILDTFPGSTVTNERIVNTQGRELHPLEGM